MMIRDMVRLQFPSLELACIQTKPEYQSVWNWQDRRCKLHSKWPARDGGDLVLNIPAHIAKIGAETLAETLHVPAMLCQALFVNENHEMHVVQASHPCFVNFSNIAFQHWDIPHSQCKHIGGSAPPRISEYLEANKTFKKLTSIPYTEKDMINSDSNHCFPSSLWLQKAGN